MKLLKQQEFVVGGWTEPRQTRSFFGSLLVGYYDDGWRAALGGTVGTGFDQEELDRVAKLLAARADRQEPVRGCVQDDGEGALGPAGPGRRNPVHGMDERRAAAAPVYLGRRTDKKRATSAGRSRSGANEPPPRLKMDGRYRKNKREQTSGSLARRVGTQKTSGVVPLRNASGNDTRGRRPPSSIS